jgi:hypothetical protein
MSDASNSRVALQPRLVVFPFSCSVVLLFSLSVLLLPPPLPPLLAILTTCHAICSYHIVYVNLSMSDEIDFSLSNLSLLSSGSQNEDWDSSLILSDTEPPSPSHSQSQLPQLTSTTPRNSVIFPMDDGATPGRSTSTLSSSTTTPGAGKEGTGRTGDSEKGNSKRSLSELLKLHAQKGTDCKFSPEEASRVADVLGQWVGVLVPVLSNFLTYPSRPSK